jgi:hypothetical protein
LLSNLRAHVTWSSDHIDMNLFASESTTPMSDTADIKEDLLQLEDNKELSNVNPLSGRNL